MKKILLMLAVLILVLVYSTYQRQEAPLTAIQGMSNENDPSATAVVVAPVRQDNFNIAQFALGTVTPINVVDVKSRVAGQLINIAFVEGKMIKAGELLAQLDPKPFAAQLKLAEGQLQLSKALLENAKADVERYTLLLSQKSTSKQTLEAKESLLQQYKATVAADEAAVTRAQLQLQYTDIVAPISGRLGFRQVDIGNAVSPTSAKGIVTITQIDPIAIVFSIPEDTLPKVLKQMQLNDNISVDIYDRAMHKKMATGQLLAVDNQIDPHTGTVKLKAQLNNSNGQFYANQFVNVSMIVETYPQTTLIPTSAIQRGTQGTFVYLVDADNLARVTKIAISATQGEVSAISTAIPSGALVVTQGGDRLKANAKVKIISNDENMSDNDAQ
ncbi:efflux RND transporter periplasmic adaptor subunit [Psychromonas sp. MME1]|uniref:efflux RND transporter periplasmic adaptor subunit n=1 Tax=Psychromonas sp. MME1 TaxID=3231032 RepID=UPI0034E1A9EB